MSVSAITCTAFSLWKPNVGGRVCSKQGLQEVSTAAAGPSTPQGGASFCLQQRKVCARAWHLPEAELQGSPLKPHCPAASRAPGEQAYRNPGESPALSQRSLCAFLHLLPLSFPKPHGIVLTPQWREWGQVSELPVLRAEGGPGSGFQPSYS